MIILARLARGRSQGELASAVKVSQGLISRIEHGAAIAPDGLVEDIAEVLEYPPSFFHRHEHVRGSDSICFHHRKRTSMPARLLDTIEAQMYLTQLQVRSLLEDLDIESSYQFVTLDPAEYGDDPRAVAQMLRRIWRISSGPIPNLVQMIEAAGGIVVFRDFGTLKLDGMSCWPKGSPPLFFINSLMPMDRLRFTLAHELGHLVMHSTPPDQHPEIQANDFALEFLAPMAEIGYDLNGLKVAKLPALKGYWRISMNALVMAAKTTGALPEPKVKSLFVQLSRNGYRTHEPYPLSPEDPSLLQMAIEFHIREHGYSYDELAAQAGMLMPEFQTLYAPPADPNTQGLRVLS
jgi:Zn-dependent peptidase ImmA (M78 family)